MSVWISDEKLLIFASLISPSKMILFEKKYQTFDTVFHHQMKHCISCLIYYLKAIFARKVIAREAVCTRHIMLNDMVIALYPY